MVHAKKMKAYFKNESEEIGPDRGLSISEACFINSLRHYARDLKLSPNFVDLPDKDFHVSNWSNVFLDYAKKYPECVARYDGMKIYQEILVNDKEYDRDEYDEGKEDYKEHKKNESGQDIFCGFCGQKNQLSFKFCTACGKTLEELAEDVTGDVQKEMLYGEVVYMKKKKKLDTIAWEGLRSFLVKIIIIIFLASGYLFWYTQFSDFRGNANIGTYLQSIAGLMPGVLFFWYILFLFTRHFRKRIDKGKYFFLVFY